MRVGALGGGVLSWLVPCACVCVVGFVLGLFVSLHSRLRSWPFYFGVIISLYYLDQGFSKFFICVPLLHTLKTFSIPLGYTFPNLCTPIIIICIPLCYNLHTLELFAHPLELFACPLGLNYSRFRNPDLDQTFWSISKVKKSQSRIKKIASKLIFHVYLGKMK